MISVDTVRELVAELPETTESAHHGHPDFRVRKRIFATLWPDQGRSVVRITAVEARALASSRPEVFRVVSDREPLAWLSVQLAAIAREEFQDLLEEAWKLRAPPDLVRD
jgi:hypothetical protein